MNQEIERKFLLRDDSFRRLATRVHHIRQGYLSDNPDCTVRVRLQDETACITVKGRNREGGIAHFEWEKPITLADAQTLLPLCGKRLIEKERYVVPVGDLKVEVDVFHGNNEGLVLAEIELPDEQTPIPAIPFLGEEVTDDPHYYNSNLSQQP